MAPISVNKIIGTRIAIARSSRSLKQKDLAKKISISRSQMSRIESGERVIPASLLYKITNTLDIDPKKLDPYQPLEEIWGKPKLPL